MIRRLILATTLMVAGIHAAAAQSEEEKAASRSDALKYCSSDIGKPEQMLACLGKHKSDISDACRKVVEAHGG